MKAFLSSTYADLIEHRRLAAEALERLGQQAGRMEVFGARPEEATNACFSEVEACDIFIGIYAHRYGYIPSGSQTSITEAEFNHAVAHEKPIFCFVIDEDYPWPPKMIEGNPGNTKLQSFKQKINQAFVRDTFTTPEDLAFKLASSIGHFLTKSNQLSQRLVPKDLEGQNRKTLACRMISQTMTMLFVDLMRLLYTASSNGAHEANADRHAEFVRYADLHLRNLESHVLRLSASLGADLEEQSCDLERELSYMLDEMRIERNLTRKHKHYFEKMHIIGEELHRFCQAALGEYYDENNNRIGTTIDRILNQHGSTEKITSLDKIWTLRLDTQSKLLELSRELGDTELYSIRDDMKHRAAILYFVLDYKILCHLAAA